MTLVFEDPYVMAIMFQAMNKRFRVVGVKNKFLDDKQDIPDLHLNLAFDSVCGSPWICEVQMLFRDIQLVKDEDTAYYGE